MANIKSAVEYLLSRFKEPLDAAGVNLACTRDEIEDAVDYARSYLRIGSESSQKNGIGFIWLRMLK